VIHNVTVWWGASFPTLIACVRDRLTAAMVDPSTFRVEWPSGRVAAGQAKRRIADLADLMRSGRPQSSRSVRAGDLDENDRYQRAKIDHADLPDSCSAWKVGAQWWLDPEWAKRHRM
jgi:hypothetical protein